MVPVVDRNNFPLEPCSEEFAQKFINEKKSQTLFKRRGPYQIEKNS